MYDVAIVGGGPSGATAAEMLARQGRSVALLDKDGRIKPCGGAIPPRLIRDFDVPDSQIVARSIVHAVQRPFADSNTDGARRSARWIMGHRHQLLAEIATLEKVDESLWCRCQPLAYGLTVFHPPVRNHGCHI